MISIIIPVYNSEKTIKRCLESIYQSQYRYFEVIVIDDGSTDTSLEIVRKYPAKIIKLDKHKGCAFARNKGTQKAKREILFFVDSDILLKPDTLNKITETFNQKPEICATFGSYSKESAAPNFFSVYRNLLHHYTHQASAEDASTFWTACGAIRKSMFEKLGGFDETLNYFPIEDIAFGYKILKHGGKIYLNKQLQIKHLKHYSFFSLIKSDLVYRAIPWTKILLKERLFKRDLNLKTNNILSVVAAFIVLLALLSIKISIYFWVIVVFFVISFLLLNYTFYKFIFREKGLSFTLCSILMHYFFYLISGIGLLAGISFYVRDTLIGKIGPKHN